MPTAAAIVLEGSFDRYDCFFVIPLGATAALTDSIAAV
jgi:hypothetical protein